MAGHQYFYEDEVYRINKKGNIEFGMVLENSELLSSDESDVEELPRLKKGYIRVVWHPSGTEEVVSEKKVGLADRSLMPGDVVRRLIRGKDTQRGYCRHMHVTACVQVVGTGHVLTDIPSGLLLRLEDVAADTTVCLDSWVGFVKTVHNRLKVRLPDQSICVVSDPDSSNFAVFSDRKHPQDYYSRNMEYFPGQTLYGPMHVLSDLIEWKPNNKEHRINKNKFNKSVKVTVEEVEVESVAVHWQCRAYSRDGTSTKDQPQVWLQEDDLARLKVLNVFEPCTVQVGDRSQYVVRPEDASMGRDAWRKARTAALAAALPPSVRPRRTRHPARRPAHEKDKSQMIEESEPNEKKENCDEGGGEWFSDSDDDSHGSGSVSSVGSTGTVRHQSSPRQHVPNSKPSKKRSGAGRVKRKPPSSLIPGSKVVVETLSTRSTADVVWQDGSIECGIPSTELYPIHHLDDQEFFPGDFVVECREDACIRLYGVIQSVDHAGRTALVKWFTTYTSPDNPQPVLVTERESSVYDLKDHPDFQYRPGTVVIRVANFTGADEHSTTGQVLDNYPDGRVRVYWVEGHESMCWPQDLYKVGDYDSEEGDVWEDAASSDDDDASWITDSDDPSTTDRSQEDTMEDENLKPKLVANIEKARVAMSHLEEIFTQNPSLQTTDVMRKLLDVYKDCRYLDKLMGTTLFHESRFEGLIERVKVRTHASHRVQDQVSRLFNKPLPQHPGAETVGEETTADGKPVQNVCMRLCSLILSQLLEAHSEIVKRFGTSSEAKVSLSEATSEAASSDADSPTAVTPVVSPTVATAEPTVTNSSDPVETPLAAPVAEVDEIESLSDDALASGATAAQETPATPTTETLPPAGTFAIMDCAPNTHKYKLGVFNHQNTKTLFKSLRSEIRLLKSALPPGIWVKGFEDRMDLFSCMIRGPEETPYEGGVFFFDIQLSRDYPTSPPLVHYMSYCSDRLNPNLYEDGKVCVSLLGTWSGRGSELWTAPHSNLLQLLISIQGLILVREPYFNEAGYERQRGSQQGHENSRMYNEMVVLKLVQSMTKIMISPPSVFKQEIAAHFSVEGPKLCKRLDSWLDMSEKFNNNHKSELPETPTTMAKQLKEMCCNAPVPDFPLVPASKGFCLSLRKSLSHFTAALDTLAESAASS